MIPYGRQQITESDIDAVVEVLRSDFITQGKKVPQFEEALTSYCGAKHAVATHSATSALHIACLALGVDQGDIVWTSPISFVASANCAIYCGAKVDFVDIDPDYYHISIPALKTKLAQAQQTHSLPKVLIPVHMCGQSCDMESIHQLSQQYGFHIIEDASHAVGGRYQNKAIGNCGLSDISIFSFHPVKIITSGEGGMALTNNEELALRLRRLRSHGITSDKTEFKLRPADEIWYYQQKELGFNYRMTDIAASLGTSQLERLDSIIEKRHAIARRYDQELKQLPITVPKQHPDSHSSYHLYPVLISRETSPKTQKEVFQALHAANIRANLHYIPIYRQPFYEAMGFQPNTCPNAEQYYRETVSLPIYPTLTKDQQTFVIETLSETLTQ